MKKVPFYPNHDDDMHCQMAAYSSILDYFLEKRLSWEELEQLTGYKSGKTAWTIEALPKMAAMGLDIRMIEPFDYKKYLAVGEKYLHTLYRPEEIDWYKKNSNLVEMKKFIPEFEGAINHECRKASLNDIDNMLNEGRLVFITLNSQTLNGKAGFVAHVILVIGKQGNKYIAHDSGLPPRPSRKISSMKLLESMGGKDNTAEVTGFKLK